MGYDSFGNMTSISVGSRKLASYDYGSQNGNLRSMTYGNGITIGYTYDILGRITEESWEGKAKYQYVYSADGYLAKKVDVTTGKAVNYEYDSLGRLIHSYQYDADGIRTRKTNYDGGYTEYYVVNGLPVAEQRFKSNGTKQYILRYLYDESNSPVGFGIYYPTAASPYWQYYYFGKNLQGDVIALYRSDYNSTSKTYTPTLVATYTYDPWGTPIGIFDANGSTISQTAYHVAAYNPFRYRGYRYDGDTRLYYLKSRYYDPAIGRFINADGFYSTNQGFAGYNMFAYCNNNPTQNTDPSGCLTKSEEAIAIKYFGTVWNFYQYRDKYELSSNSPTTKKSGKSSSQGFKSGSYVGYDNWDTLPGNPFHEQAMLIEISGVDINKDDKVPLSVGASFTLMTGGWDLGNAKINLFDFLHGEAFVGFTSESFGVGAIVSLLHPNASVSLGPLDITVTGEIGALGAGIGYTEGSFKIGAASGVGLSLSISW